MKKSTRHRKILGDFGERLICNWLSRSGFEVAIVDHTGIDIVAYFPQTQSRIGITVKSRTRNKGKEAVSVTLFKNEDDRKKLSNACEAFGCKPWIAVYVETSSGADVFLTSLKNFDEKYRGGKRLAVDTWKMGQKYKDAYGQDTAVKHIGFTFDLRTWHYGMKGKKSFKG